MCGEEKVFSKSATYSFENKFSKRELNRQIKKQWIKEKELKNCSF